MSSYTQSGAVAPDSHVYVNGAWTQMSNSSGVVYAPQAPNQQWITGSNGSTFYNTGYNPTGN